MNTQQLVNLSNQISVLQTQITEKDQVINEIKGKIEPQARDIKILKEQINKLTDQSPEFFTGSHENNTFQIKKVPANIQLSIYEDKQVIPLFIRIVNEGENDIPKIPEYSLTYDSTEHRLTVENSFHKEFTFNGLIYF